MNQVLLRHVASQSLRKKIPTIEAGMSVKVSQKIKEGEKERVQNFEGLVIAANGGKGVGGTFTVRKIVGGIGVEKVFPLHSSTISKIEIIKKAKVRRSKLYYMRELSGRAARMSETHIHEVVHDDEAGAKAAKQLADSKKDDKESKDDKDGKDNKGKAEASGERGEVSEAEAPTETENVAPEVKLKEEPK
ncbi:50S ribosomal protein L19 [Patescibacteria group bacterium]|nr:50S ribosomal protein L19 [Patescibacteria group bacterium]